MTDQVQDFSVHVRYDGRSYEFGASQLDLGDLSTDDDIRNAVALELNVSREFLNGYEIDKHANGNMTLHPRATFGITVTRYASHVASTEADREIPRTKKEIQEQLLEAYKHDSPYIEVETWQDDPWTAAKVSVRAPLIPVDVIAKGFSKLCRYQPHAPHDVWDAQFGKELAVKKAIAKIAKRFANEQ